MINFILAFAALRVVYGRGLFPSTKATCIALMSISIGAYSGSWLVFLLAIPCIALLVKPGAGNRYMSFTGDDTRDYGENKWVCLLADKIIRTHPGDQLTREESRRWGAVYAGIQGLFILPLLVIGADLPLWAAIVSLLGALRGACWYAVKWLPNKEVYGGMVADALEGLLFALLVVLAYGQTGA